MSDLGTKRRILILDDEEMVGEITCHMLNHLGYQTTLVDEGGKAVELYQQEFCDGEPYDLVIMDLVVPGGMGGKEAVQAILAIDPSATVMASSGFANDPVMTDYADYGFVGVINKPFSMEVLQGVLEAFGPPSD